MQRAVSRCLPSSRLVQPDLAVFGASTVIPSLEANHFSLQSSQTGSVEVYAQGTDETIAPALLVHTINAAASAYEVKPLFEGLSSDRVTWAVDLPGFGASARTDRLYTPRLMTDAVLLVAEALHARYGRSIDLLGVSLGCEFVARAARDRPELFRTISLVSPTGFERRRDGEDGSTRALPAFYSLLRWSFWDRGLYENLTRPSVIRYFLERTFGSKRIDEGMLAHDVRIVREPGARFAPQSFLGGHLFSGDISRVYESLALPIWVSHGVRGDFTNYRGLKAVRDRPNWKVTVFQTGALPYFELTDAFMRELRAFLAQPQTA
jgi:pimeloyl-ACP methyl ester carboxylesterase